jgi:hypothetical protein
METRVLRRGGSLGLTEGDEDGKKRRKQSKKKANL